MKNKIQKIFLPLLVFFLLVLPLVSGAQWDPGKYVDTMLPTAPSGVSGVINGFMMWLLSIFSLITVIAFAVSGIMYLTSAGDDKQIENAKRYMQWSIIGVIVGLSGLIVINEVHAMLGGGCWITFLGICIF